MCGVRTDDLACAFQFGHSHRVVSFLSDIFEPPKAINWRPESTTKYRSLEAA
jgi:hypothetical protein